MTVEEDYERLSEEEKMYLHEREMEIWCEYIEYMEEEERKKRLPARIEVVMPGVTNKKLTE